MNNTEIQLPRKLTNQLLHWAQISPETEICGLIGAQNGIPGSSYPIDNIAQHPQTRFQLDPKQHIDAIARMRKNGEELFAIYHSHPTAPAVPSATDIEMADYPETLYLIISLNTKGVLEMRGFNIKDNNVQEIPLSMIQEWG
jgi:proteasome lid subunit RPN8/RPN11